jgi:ribosomal protein S18 acetylase RimI-like enzyme
VYRRRLHRGAVMGDRAISVRSLGAEDGEKYRAIRLEALERHPEAFGSTFEAEAAQPPKWFSARLRSSTVFGAFLRAELVGIAGFSGQAAAKQRHKGVLWGMYVRPSGRGLGVGRRLVGAVIAHARLHVEILQLTVVSANDGARRLYVDMGFSEYGVEERGLKWENEYFDEVLMAMFLTRAGGR